jgi:hypothetical protein
MEDCHQLLILDVTQALPDMGFAQKSEMGHQLTEPHIRR